MFRDMKFDPTSKEVIDNPYPYYAHLRQSGPAVWNDVLQGRILCGYEDVKYWVASDAASTRRVSMAFERLTPEQKQEIFPKLAVFKHWTLFQDRPEHTANRQAISSPFHPSQINKLQDSIRTLVERLVDDIPAKGPWDFIEKIAYPLPIQVIGSLIGIPPGQERQLKKWSHDLSVYFASPQMSYEEVQEKTDSLQAMFNYFKAIAVEKRANPGTDFISQLLREGQKSDDEIAGVCSQVLFAGHETTTHLLANSADLFLSQNKLENQNIWQALAADTSLIPAAIEESLRMESPVQYVARVLTQDINYANTHFEKGTKIYVCFGAANRDEKIFSNPDSFDLNRTPNRHLAFGSGPHFCLGAHLARTEAKIAFEILATRFPKLTLLSGQQVRRRELGFRGFTRLMCSNQTG